MSYSDKSKNSLEGWSVRGHRETEWISQDVLQFARFEVSRWWRFKSSFFGL